MLLCNIQPCELWGILELFPLGPDFVGKHIVACLLLQRNWLACKFPETRREPIPWVGHLLLEMMYSSQHNPTALNCIGWFQHSIFPVFKPNHRWGKRGHTFLIWDIPSSNYSKRIYIESGASGNIHEQAQLVITVDNLCLLWWSVVHGISSTTTEALKNYLLHADAAKTIKNLLYYGLRSYENKKSEKKWKPTWRTFNLHHSSSQKSRMTLTNPKHLYHSHPICILMWKNATQKHINLFGWWPYKQIVHPRKLTRTRTNMMVWERICPFQLWRFLVSKRPTNTRHGTVTSDATNPQTAPGAKATLEVSPWTPVK